MEKKHIISLAGDLAAGKGTVSDILIKELNYGIYRNGEYAGISTGRKADQTDQNHSIRTFAWEIFADMSKHAWANAGGYPPK